MNVKFIKWKVDKADGFSLKQYMSEENGNSYFLCYKKISEELGTDRCGWLCEHLLTKAIEGVNRVHNRFEIMQEREAIHIVDRYKSIHENCIVLSLPVSDKAKESALMYIYEQETLS